jgi:hypothetical protein
VRYIALGAVFIQIRWLIAQHRHSLKCIIVNALYIAYIKRFYIANDKTQSSVVRRKAAFVSWLSVLGAPSWCVGLRRLEMSTYFFALLASHFLMLASQKVTKAVVVGSAWMPTWLWMFGRLLFALLASYFSLLAQRISNQKKVHPNFRLIPVLLGLPGGNQKLAPLELKQLLADNSRQPCVARRGRWGPRTPYDCNHSRIEEKESGF